MTRADTTDLFSSVVYIYYICYVFNTAKMLKCIEYVIYSMYVILFYSDKFGNRIYSMCYCIKIEELMLGD